jgi:hypothetical protein
MHEQPTRDRPLSWQALGPEPIPLDDVVAQFKQHNGGSDELAYHDIHALLLSGYFRSRVRRVDATGLLHAQNPEPEFWKEANITAEIRLGKFMSDEPMTVRATVSSRQFKRGEKYYVDLWCDDLVVAETPDASPTKKPKKQRYRPASSEVRLALLKLFPPHGVVPPENELSNSKLITKLEKQGVSCHRKTMLRESGRAKR